MKNNLPKQRRTKIGNNRLRKMRLLAGRGARLKRFVKIDENGEIETEYVCTPPTCSAGGARRLLPTRRSNTPDKKTKTTGDK